MGTSRMPDPGDVVTVDFTGIAGTKRRPAVVVSSDLYHSCRPDLILGILTTRILQPGPVDYALQDWSAAGLKQPSTFRAYLGMATPADVRVIGRLSERDWEGVQQCVARSIAMP